MQKISYSRHRFPPQIIQHAVWLYARFTLSYRDVEDLLAVRGLNISYETARRWFLKFGEPIARNLRSKRPTPSDIWHLDEMVIVIRGKRYFLWRAVDSEGEVLDFLLQPKRNAKAALKLMRKLLKKQEFAPSQIVIDKLKSYHKAFRTLHLNAEHIDNKRSNNRAENSHQPFRGRERATIKFRSANSLQKFASIHSSIQNHFNHERHLNNREILELKREIAHADWRQLSA
jgi:transposase-like protein